MLNNAHLTHALDLLDAVNSSLSCGNAHSEFFSLPDQVKSTLLKSGSGGLTRGYIGVGQESGSDTLEYKEVILL